jgi:tubulin-folding cofactor B
MYSLPSNTAELREYVLATPSGIQNRAASTIIMHVTHSNLQRDFPEIRLDRHMSLESVKEKLYSSTGTQAANMRLILKDCTGRDKQELAGDDKMLGYFSPEEGDTLHIIDLDPHSASAAGWLDDTNLVQKYEMSKEDYTKRKGTVHQWKKQVLAEKQAAATSNTCAQDTEEVPAIKVGERCEVFPGGRRAWVRFVGLAPVLGPGYWVGVEYDEPVGKNDGAVKGTRFFHCAANFGGMVKPETITVGDYPTLEEELALSDKEDL